MNLAEALFKHWKTNSCGVLIGYYGTKKIEVINKKCDNYGRILSLEIKHWWQKFCSDKYL